MTAELERIEVRDGLGVKTFAGRWIVRDELEERPAERNLHPDPDLRFSVALTAGGRFAVHVTHRNRPESDRLTIHQDLAKALMHVPVNVAAVVRSAVPIPTQELDV